MDTNAKAGPQDDLVETGVILGIRAMAALRKHTPPAAPDDCWLWTGTISSNGYGFIRVSYEGLTYRVHAHRFALAASGVTVPRGLDACHRCDVRACVNPAHLFVGTRSENMRDMMQKGRRQYAVGADHARAKLSDDDVRTIRHRVVVAGETQARVARDYRVNSATVSRIARRLYRREVA